VTQDQPGVVASSVCPSGYRAALERSSSRYVGDNQGWGRKDDLIDEQDGPYYFMAWEPNYPQPVTVEITLAQSVQAVEFRVFQDPFTAVDGDITIEAAGRRFDIALSGMDGWRSHVFDQPVTVDSFTVSRSQAEANIMEVMVCAVVE
jgi:hypothetical protein